VCRARDTCDEFTEIKPNIVRFTRRPVSLSPALSISRARQMDAFPRRGAVVSFQDSREKSPARGTSRDARAAVRVRVESSCVARCLAPRVQPLARPVRSKHTVHARSSY
jgi:hypothetical protein